MERNTRNWIASICSRLEICLSILILVGIAIMAVEVVRDIFRIVNGIFDASMAVQYEVFIGDVLKLVVGIEFVKMLARQTPESVIEVLLFAMARRIVAGNPTGVDIVIGIGAIGVLFAVRRYLLPPGWSDQRRESRSVPADQTE